MIPIVGSNPENQKLFEYGQIAWNIVQGHGYSWDFEGRFPLAPTAYSPALYTYSLVPWFALFGVNLIGPRLMHAVLLAAVAWFLYKIGERLINRRVGLLAAAIWAIYPEMIFLGMRIAPENLMFPLMMAMMWFVQAPREAMFGRTALMGGALTGLAAWTNPSLQLLAIIVPAHWWINGHLKSRQGLRRLALFAIGGIIIVAPWTIRNYIRFGAFVPLRTAFAYNVWRGNHPGATGTVYTFEGRNIDEAMDPAYAAYVEQHMVPDEIERDRFFAREVERFISERPLDYIRLSLRRLGYFWWRDRTHALTGNVFYWMPWLLILMLAAVGLYSIRSHWRAWSLWLMPIVGFMLLFSLTVYAPRYRMTIYPSMFLLAAVGVDQCLRKFGIAGGRIKP